MPRRFADDTALLITGKTSTDVGLQRTSYRANSELKKVSQWMVANNLVINASKIVALNISPKVRNGFDFDTQSINQYDYSC